MCVTACQITDTYSLDVLSSKLYAMRRCLQFRKLRGFVKDIIAAVCMSWHHYCFEVFMSHRMKAIGMFL